MGAHLHLEVWSRALASSVKPQGQEAAGQCLAHSGTQLMFVELKWGDCCEPSIGHRQWQISHHPVRLGTLEIINFSL